MLLDNGLFGFLLVMPLYFYALFKSVPLVLERHDPLVCTIGCTAFCLILALMVGAFGGQTFYPREGAVGMWVAIAIMLRVAVQRSYSLPTGVPLFEDDEVEDLSWSAVERAEGLTASDYRRSSV
jgi:hypothetical protein